MNDKKKPTPESEADQSQQDSNLFEEINKPAEHIAGVVRFFVEKIEQSDNIEELGQLKWQGHGAVSGFYMAGFMTICAAGYAHLVIDDTAMERIAILTEGRTLQ